MFDPWLPHLYYLGLLIRFINVILPIPGGFFANLRYNEDVNISSVNTSLFLDDSESFRFYYDRYTAHAYKTFSSATTYGKTKQRLPSFLSPERTLIFPWLFSTVPMVVLQVLAQLGQLRLSLWSSIIGPRLVAFAFSYMIDLNLYSTVRKWYLKPNLSMFLYCSSYITVSLFSGPQHCLVECFLYAAVLRQLSLCTEFGPHSHCGHASHTAVRNTALKLGALLAVGVWNKPTFLFFVLPQLLQYCTKELSCSFSALLILWIKLSSLFLAFLFAGSTMTAIDSSLAGTLNLEMLVANWDTYSRPQMFRKILRHNFTSAPVNYIQKNLQLNFTNCTVEPVYWHALVSVPVLFGPLGLLCIYYSLQCASWRVLKQFHYIDPLYWLFLSSFAFPLLAFSSYPIKHVYRVIPLMFPTVLICTVRLCDYSTKFRTRILTLWCCFNCILFSYHALLKNGGNYPLMRLFAHKFAVNPKAKFEIFFVKTEIFPYDYFLEKVYSNKLNLYYSAKWNRATRDRILNLAQRNSSAVYLVAANTTDIASGFRKSNIKLISRHWPHITELALPKLTQLNNCKYKRRSIPCPRGLFLDRVVYSMTLNCYRIKI